ncbi:hypothetical protein EJ03DRAFT_1988 [Teratosphaeria nubilosa]|uniref:Uncharacterized protein n=1 Tax=Teratosphaeria nubilosa TaxID=161662 RepID=A0A6G1LN13_9PEZI|nr:hypothetical protein EJ03DRAFT_1988 [Teratosphaeria nubilosa]
MVLLVCMDRMSTADFVLSLLGIGTSLGGSSGFKTLQCVCTLRSSLIISHRPRNQHSQQAASHHIVGFREHHSSYRTTSHTSYSCYNGHTVDDPKRKEAMRPALGFRTTILLCYGLLLPVALAWYNCCKPNTCGYGNYPIQGMCVPNGDDLKKPGATPFACDSRKPCEKQSNGCTPPAGGWGTADCSD